MPNIRRANAILAILYASMIGALWLGGWVAGPLWALLSMAPVLIAYLIYDQRLGRIARPCGHMSVRKGGRLGFNTPFIHRACPMCGDRIEDAPPSPVKAR